MKSYSDLVFAIEGDIFKSCMLERAPMRKLIIEGLFSLIRKLESYLMFNVPPGVTYIVANAIDTAGKIGTLVDWIDREIGEIITKQ